MSQHVATINRGASSQSKRVFARHFVEMLLVMFLGMGLLEGAAALAFGLSGSSISAQSVEFRVLLMGANMAVPMALWMAYRGHTGARNAEMAASMIVPSVIVAAIAWAGALEAGSALGIQHAIMVPAMLGVMLWRYDEYSSAPGPSSSG